MSTVREQLAQLEAAQASGALARLCANRGVELLVLFGSAATPDAEPGDIDIAVAFQPGQSADLVGLLDALSELVPGDHLDVMDLGRAGPVAQQRALTKCRVLYATSPAAFYERQIFAINQYIETQPLRDALLRSLAS